MIHGRCGCGAVRLELLPPTLFASHCHCESCRRTHAAAFVTWTAVPPDRLVIHGALTTWESSPGVYRRFCGRCGAHVVYDAAAAPDRRYVPVAVLDDLDRPVEEHVSYEERVSWLAGVESLPCRRDKDGPPLPW